VSHLGWQRVAPWVVPLLLLAAWQAAAQLGWLSTRILPAPWDVAKAAVALSLSGELWSHVWTSTWRALTGFAIGGGLALTLGLLTGSSTKAETLLDSTIQMIRNIPPLALIPLVILWFGIEEKAKLFLVSLGVFFPIYINTFHGIRSVDKGRITLDEAIRLRRPRARGSAAFAELEDRVLRRVLRHPGADNAPTREHATTTAFERCRWAI